ncbi:MAG: hypothetical protein AAF368_10055, partial [Planctomycetota bacterium]
DTDPKETMDLFPSWVGPVPEGMLRAIQRAITNQRALRRGESIGAGAATTKQLSAIGYADTADADSLDLDDEALIERKKSSQDE